MNRFSQLLAIFFLVCFSSLPAHCETLEHIANIKNVEGNVFILREGTKMPAVKGMQLFSSDSIVSDSGASTGIIFTDGTSLAVGPSSEIDIQNYLFEPQDKQYDFSLYMKKGSALYSTGKLGKLSPESVKLNTPRATVGVRGTRFIVKVD